MDNVTGGYELSEILTSDPLQEFDPDRRRVRGLKLPQLIAEDNDANDASKAQELEVAKSMDTGTPEKRTLFSSQQGDFSV
jgi:hypothetical protein